MKKSIFLLSSSSVHGYGFLEYNKSAIQSFFEDIGGQIVFVPFAAARVEWDSYTEKVARFFATIGIAVRGLHTVDRERIFTDYKAIFIGGGNTFRLLHELQLRSLLQDIRAAVLDGRVAYMGSSAGTNMATKSICTTNDMPIVYPQQGFEALNLFTYQINPHYLDPEPETKHKGETRDQRIAEFHQENSTPVVGLREGSYILMGPDFGTTHKLFIGGQPGAKVFAPGKKPFEAPRETEFVLTPEGDVV